MSNKLREGRDLLFDIEAEVARRARNLILAGRFVVSRIAEDLTEAVFGMVIAVVDSGFAIVKQGMITVLGERTDPLKSFLVSNADYDAGFADGRAGTVPKSIKAKKSPK